MTVTYCTDCGTALPPPSPQMLLYLLADPGREIVVMHNCRARADRAGQELRARLDEAFRDAFPER